MSTRFVKTGIDYSVFYSNFTEGSADAGLFVCLEVLPDAFAKLPDGSLPRRSKLTLNLHNMPRGGEP